jgi:hypothetical protein
MRGSSPRALHDTAPLNQLPPNSICTSPLLQYPLIPSAIQHAPPLPHLHLPSPTLTHRPLPQHDLAPKARPQRPSRPRNRRNRRHRLRNCTPTRKPRLLRRTPLQQRPRRRPSPPRRVQRSIRAPIRQQIRRIQSRPRRLGRGGHSQPPCRLHPRTTNPTPRPQVRELHEHVVAILGPPTILVNNAGSTDGLTGVKSADEVSIASFERTWRVNCGAAYLLAQLCLPAMEGEGWGRVVFVSSVAGITGGIIGPHYA